MKVNKYHIYLILDFLYYFLYSYMYIYTVHLPGVGITKSTFLRDA